MVGCVICGAVDDLTKHHIIPLSMGIKDNSKIVVCRKCHDDINYHHFLGYLGSSNRSEKYLGNYRVYHSIIQSLLDEIIRLEQGG